MTTDNHALMGELYAWLVNPPGAPDEYVAGIVAHGHEVLMISESLEKANGFDSAVRDIATAHGHALRLVRFIRDDTVRVVEP